MSIKILTERRTVESVRFTLNFQFIGNANCGEVFDCDENGVVDEASLSWVKQAMEGVTAVPPTRKFLGIRREVHSYREPAVARCTCGSKVFLEDPLDNVCGGCQRVYNSCGQEVVASWDCDEQGNPYEQN